MKSIEYFLILMCASLSLTGCGEFKQNPIAEYQTGVAPYVKDTTVREGKTSSFYIKPLDHLNFVENEERTVRFKVLFNEELQNVKYTLSLVENGYIKPQALTKATNDADTWVLNWRPAQNTANAIDGSSSFEIKIKFNLDAKSSSAESVKALAGLHSETEYQVTVVKNSDQPQIEEVLGMSPAPEVNPGSSIKIGFIVSAKGMTTQNISDFQINLLNGPEQPTSELVRMNANSGILNPARFVRLLEPKDGRSRAEYQIVFAADNFIERAMNAIYANGKLKNRFLAASLNQVEAQFGLDVLNKQNGRRSGETLINFKVNLTGKVIASSLVGEEQTEISKGTAANSNKFVIMAGDTRSIVKLVNIEVEGETLNFRTEGSGQEKVEFTSPNLAISFSCGAGTQWEREKFYACENQQCFKSCVVSTQASCDAKTQKYKVKIGTQTQLGAETLEQKLEYTVAVKETNECGSSHVAAKTEVE